MLLLKTLQKGLLFSLTIILVFVATSWQSIYAQQYQVSLTVLGFNGLTISAPTVVNENVNSIQHTQSILFSVSPEIPENITVNISSNISQCILSSPIVTLTFTGTGTMSATTNITAVNDGVAETPAVNSCPLSYVFSSTNPLYNGTQSTVLSIVEWNPSLVIGQINQVDENPLSTTHSRQLSVRLSDQPSGNVTYLVSFDNTQLDIAPKTVLFTPTNWNSNQLITYTADNDGIAEATPHFTQVSFTATSSSAVEYANKIISANIAIRDFTVTIPSIVRTGATQILPVLGFASFVMILVYFFVTSNRTKPEDSLKSTI